MKNFLDYTVSQKQTVLNTLCDFEALVSVFSTTCRVLCAATLGARLTMLIRTTPLHWFTHYTPRLSTTLSSRPLTSYRHSEPIQNTLIWLIRVQTITPLFRPRSLPQFTSAHERPFRTTATHPSLLLYYSTIRHDTRSVSLHYIRHIASHTTRCIFNTTTSSPKSKLVNPNGRRTYNSASATWPPKNLCVKWRFLKLQNDYLNTSILTHKLSKPWSV